VIPATSRTLSLAVPGQVRYSPDSREIVLDETATPEFGFFLVNNSTTLTIRPSDGLFLPSYTLNSADPQGFSRVNHTISGRVDRVWFTSPDLNSSEFGEHTLYDNWEILRGTEYTDEVGANASMNFTIELPDYNPAGMIDTAVTRRYTSDEYQIYNIALQKADRADGMTDIAYVLHCNKNALEGTGPATLTMTVSRDWVVHYSQFIIPEHRLKLYKLDENGNPVFDASWNYVFLNTSLLSRDPSTREYVFVVSDPGGINLSRMALWGAPFEQDFPDSPIRVIEYDSESLLPASVTLAVNASYLENNLNGTRWHYVEEPMTIVRVNDTGGTEVLDTKFLYYDPVRKVDVFQAYSPQGLSEFALMPVYTAGNPLQMIYLSLNTRVTPTPAPTPAPMSTRTIPYGSAGGGGGGGYSGSGTIGTVPVTQGAATGTTPSLNEQSIALADDGALIPSEQAGARSEVPLPSPSGHVSVPPQAVAPTQGMTVSIFTVVAELAIMVSACVLVMVSIYVRRKNQ